MNKKQIKQLENLLDERFEIALINDERLGNKDGGSFLPNNPDYIYYKAIIETIETLGYCWERTNTKHRIYK